MNTTNKAIKIFNDDLTVEQIIKDCKFCHLALSENDNPYLVAMNFGYKNKIFYLHSSREGRKIDILQKNNKVALFFTSETQLFHRDYQIACSWRMKYKSVQVIGTSSFVEDYEEKIDALKIFMKNYDEYNFKFSKPAVDNISVIKVEAKQWTARTFEY